MSNVKHQSTPSDSDTAKDLFIRCVEAPDSDAYEAILQGADSSLADQVRRLLASVDRGDVIENVFEAVPLIDVDATADMDLKDLSSNSSAGGFAFAESAGTQIENYKLLEQIGEGGMGTVFMAQQTKPIKRRVAVKVVKPGMDSRQVVARFEAERQSLALMDHANIARVFDGGTAPSGRPYFVMELVKGIPLTEFCQSKNVPLRERLRLFIDLCRGVQHAHQRGIIHRDLKPSNVLVTLHDGDPVIKIIDFGIAKAMNSELTDKTLFTQFAAMVGTPLYMSPEQAELSGLDVDTRSDVYSLGVLLYELLTDVTPFDREALKQKGLDEVRRMIRETEPARPSQKLSTVKASGGDTIDLEKLRDIKKAKSVLSGELDWIAMKALEKDRDRRYQSAAEFADDVQRHLDGEAVQACPPSLRYQLGRFARRHRVLLAAVSLVMVTAAVGTCASLVFADRARHAAKEAVAAKQVAETEATRAMSLAVERDAAADRFAVEAQRAKQAEKLAKQQRRKTQTSLYRESIRAADAQLRQQQDADAIKTLISHISDEQQDDHRSWEWYYLLGKTRISDRGWFAQFVGESAEWSPDGQQILTTGRTQDSFPTHTGMPEGRIWETQTGSLLHELEGWFGTARLNPARPVFATNFVADNLYGSHVGTGVIQLLDLANHQQTSIPVPGVFAPGLVEWNREGDRIAVGGESIVIFRRSVGEWQIEHRLESCIAVGGWSSDDRYFVAKCTSPGIQIFDGGTLELTKEIQAIDKLPYRSNKRRFGQWHPQNPWFAYPVAGKRIAVLDVNSEEIIAELDLSQYFRDLRFSPDGKLLAVGGSEGVIDIWKVSDWQKFDRIAAHDTFVETVSWSPDSTRLLSLGIDGYCAIWSFDRPKIEYFIDLPNGEDLRSFEWIDDETIRYSVAGDRICNRKITKDKDDTLVPIRDNESWRLTSNPFAFRLLRKNGESFLEVLDLERSSTKRMRTPRPGLGTQPISVSPNGKQLAMTTAVSEDYSSGVIELGNGKFRPFDVSGIKHCNEIAWSPDGTRVAFAGTASDLVLLPAITVTDVESGKTLLEKQFGKLNFGERLRAVGWNRDGKKIVLGLPDGACYVIDSRTGVTQVIARPVVGAVRRLDWHPHDDRIVTGSGAGEIAIWDSVTGESLLTFDVEDPIRDVRWSPSGNRLAAQLSSGQIRVWDANEGYRRSASNWIEEYRREQFRKRAYQTFADAFALAKKRDLKDASDLLKPYILRDVSDGNSGELHPWALDSIAYGYFLYTGLHSESTGDVATATDAYVRAAELGLRHHEALDSLADLIADGLVVDDFEKLIDKAYAAWAEDWSETLRLIRLSPNDDYVRRRSRKIAETHDTFASIYGRGTSNLEKVVTLLEKAVEYDAQNAKYRLRLAEAYFANSQAERAIESAEKAIELKPDFRKASQAIEKYRSAASE